MRSALGLLIPLFSASTALAQAPGEVAPDPEPVPPSATPTIIANPSTGIDVMRRGWADGHNLGGMPLPPNDDTTGTETQFRTGELSIRYRATPHFELELLLSGGRQVLEDGEDGGLAMGGGTLAARYRFRAEHRWNWWLMGGLGMTVIERAHSTQEQRDSAGRAHVAFGVGLERRFNRFAIHAEMRGMAMGPREDEMDVVPQRTIDPRPAQNLSAGQFNLGASFYF